MATLSRAAVELAPLALSELTRDWLAARAAATPERLALLEAGDEWTYAELDRLVSAAGRWTLAQGIGPGDHVGVLLPNCLAFVALIHALTRIGAVLVPLNTRLTEHELAAQVAAADCTRVITTAELATGLGSAMRNAVSVCLVTERLSEVAATVSASPLLPADMAAGLYRVQAIVFTSGTTGTPKGAMLTYANHFHSALRSAFRLGVMPSDRWLACMPLYHVGGMAIILRASLYGTAVVLHQGFDSEAVHQSLLHQAVTLVSLVPTMLYRLLAYAPEAPWPSLRLVLLGGAAAPRTLLEQAAEAGVPVATTYGLTEAASQVATMPPERAIRKPGSAGRPLLFTEVRIANDAGESLEVGEVGEICVRGPNVFAGYYQDEPSTRRTLRSGELRTGDLGYLDEEGDLWVVDRRSDLIVCGGENVYPSEVERVLSEHPAVTAVCVTGLPDPEWGQRVSALVVVDEPVPADALMQYARTRLAGYKVPRAIQFVESLPLTASGKVSRQAAAEFWRGLEEPGT